MHNIGVMLYLFAVKVDLVLANSLNGHLYTKAQNVK